MVTSFNVSPAILCTETDGDPKKPYIFAWGGGKKGEPYELAIFETPEEARGALAQWGKDWGNKALAANAQVWDMDQSQLQ